MFSLKVGDKTIMDNKKYRIETIESIKVTDCATNEVIIEFKDCNIKPKYDEEEQNNCFEGEDK
jgi:hypothetical protein